MAKNLSDYDIPARRYDFQEDLKFGHKGEALVTEFLDALSGGAFEVKTDRYRNGRMVIETSQNPRRKLDDEGNAFWKPSGLMVTKAAWWVYVYTLDGGEGAFIVVNVKRMKRWLKVNKKIIKLKEFAWSSSNPSKGYLLEPEQVMDMLISKDYDAV
jgi:hypothetical protein